MITPAIRTRQRLWPSVLSHVRWLIDESRIYLRRPRLPGDARAQARERHALRTILGQLRARIREVEIDGDPNAVDPIAVFWELRDWAYEADRQGDWTPTEVECAALEHLLTGGVAPERAAVMALPNTFDPGRDSMARDSAPESGAEPPAAKPLKPGNLALAAALQLRKEGRSVSLKAACKLAGVCPKNLRRNHPDAAKAIREMAAPERVPNRGVIDRRTGRLDAVVDDDDDDDDDD